MNGENGKIVIFARTPELGAVKTRLEPHLGEQGCYELHEELVTRTLDTALASEVAPVDVWHTGNAAHPFWRDLQKTQDFGLREQVGADLGERMVHAFETSLSDRSNLLDWVILIGSDCPEITPEYLRDAAKLLSSGREAVIGPAEDGGYVLIGLRSPKQYLFQDVSWGTATVLEKTSQNATQNSCKISLLKALRDLDTKDDLDYFRDQFGFFSA